MTKEQAIKDIKKAIKDFDVRRKESAKEKDFYMASHYNAVSIGLKSALETVKKIK